MNKIIHFNINNKPEDIKLVFQIEELCKSNIQLNEEDVRVLLSHLSYLVRKLLADSNGVDMSEYSYYYKCDTAQSMICYYLNSLGIKTNPVNTNEVINGVCGYSLVLATFDTTSGEKTFLIDPTYIQFFSKEKCDKSNFVVINDIVCVSPDPGYFIVEDNKEEVILPLLNDGYIEFNEEVASAYGNSFFQTKQGTQKSQIKNNKASGSNYIKWFTSYTSSLSKTKEELLGMGLLIRSMNEESIQRR